MTKLMCAFGLVLLCASCASTGYTYRRAYEPGETYRYKMVRTYNENGEFKREEVAESVHQVPGEGSLRERIQFVKLTKRTSEGTEDLSEAIAAFPPYEASMAAVDDPDALTLPDIKGWDMGVVGPVTDLHTFLVAVSPQIGAQKVDRPGKMFGHTNGVKGDWSNGESILVGEDCIRTAVTLVEVTTQTAVYETTFLPPLSACLEMLKPWMEAPVVEGTPNNFQQHMDMGGMHAVMWGREEFTVRSKVRRSDGLILSATMDNPLTLKLKVGCDAALDSCKVELPMKIHRKLTLELIQ